MKQIASALLKAQTEMSNPVKGNSNPFFKSKYADLNSVREATIPVLNANGIIVLQPMVHIEGRNFVKTVLMHESGESIESFTEILYNKTNDAQAQGSGITYARRYGLQSMVCVGADDDDGNAASKSQSLPAPINVDLLNKAVEDMLKCSSREEMGKIWEANKAFQKQSRFINATKTIGEKYPKS